MRNHVKTILVWFSAVLVLVAGTVVGTNFVTAISAPSAGSVAVTFNYNGATGGNTSPNETVTSGTQADDVLPHPTKPGVSFSGWFNTQSLLNGQRITTIEDSDAGALIAGYVPGELAQTLNLTLPSSCANGLASCDVGDPGPGGGTVFYVDMARAAGSQFWEVGSDLGTAQWGCDGTDISGASGVAIGDGEANTSLINAGCVTPGIAARVASASAGGYSDWFLPSQDELNQLCKYARNQSTSVADQTVVCDSTFLLRGGFAGGGYWSSSQAGANHARFQDFDFGYKNLDRKYNPMWVRPVRAF